MKNIIFLLLVISTSVSFGQKRIKFTYDSAGNQTSRIICLNNCAAKNSNEVYKDSATITEQDLIKDVEYEELSYYPNPVKEELYVKWKNKNEIFVSSIEIYSMTGQLIKNYSNLKNKENVSIAFQSFPVGMYNLLLYYTNGEKKTLKIVKNNN